MKGRRNIAELGDPLELMLDTLSNVFGGIILIACLLALIPRQTSQESRTIESQARGEMIERRLSVAKEQLAEAEKAIDELTHDKDPSDNQLNLKYEQLTSLAEDLRDESEALENAELSNAELEALVRSGDPEALEKELERLKRLTAEAEGSSKSVGEKIEFLTERLEALSEEAENLKQGITRQLRFPREREGSNNPFPVIVRGGEIFPLSIGSDLEQNAAVRMIPVPGGDAYRAQPLIGKGFKDPLENNPFLQSLRAAKKKNGYVSIYLYPDSHGVFRELKDALFKESIGYGIEFVPAFRELSFGSSGTMPPEL